ncbi:prepilin-type N-terminal cleavage/methylation domain-containing protein [Candidatus Uhrbacteria bacterium]|nr:prepilin-type N-terminal cleavage/methylation domain-containing protein [Candidatus Uhrbacteria bacterium]
MSIFEHNKGFTLVELVVYIGLASIVFLAVIGQQMTFLQMRVKHQTIAQVEQEGQFVMQLITQTLRNAQAINSPPAGSSASILSIDVFDAVDDPTVFDVSGGQIRLTQGSAAAVEITSGLLSVASFTIENVSRLDTPGSVRIQFTLSRINAGGVIPYAYEKTFYGTASLRP